MTAPPLSAVVLAGGLSTRMGREKALLDVEGRPLWERQRDVLAAAGANELLLSVRSGQNWARTAGGFHVTVYDGLAAGGPLVGITAAIERMSNPWLAVLAIDLPAMTPEWFQQLAKQCAPGIGIVGRHESHYEPLAAIYPRELMPLAWEALARGEFSLQRLIERAVNEGLLRVHDLAPAEMKLFENWNSPR